MVFEFDVEMNVRRTLRVEMRDGTTVADARRTIGDLFFQRGITPTTFQKWKAPGNNYPPHPVETILGDVSIVEVREVS